MVEYEKSVIFEDERIGALLEFLNSLVIKNAQEAELYETGETYAHYRDNYQYYLEYGQQTFREEFNRLNAGKDNFVPISDKIDLTRDPQWAAWYNNRLEEAKEKITDYVDKNKYYASVTGKPGTEDEKILILNLDHTVEHTPAYDKETEYKVGDIVRYLSKNVYVVSRCIKNVKGVTPDGMDLVEDDEDSWELKYPEWVDYWKIIDAVDISEKTRPTLDRINFKSVVDSSDIDNLKVADDEYELSLYTIIQKRHYLNDTFSLLLGSNIANYEIESGRRIQDMALYTVKKDYDRYKDNPQDRHKRRTIEQREEEIYRLNISYEARPDLYIYLHDLNRNENRITHDLFYYDRTYRIINVFREFYKYTYLNYLKSSIRIETARNAEHFEIISYDRDVLDDVALDSFLKVYDEVKEFVKLNKHIERLEEFYLNYSNFEIMAILFGTFQRMCNMYIDRYSIRNYTDREIDDILDSYNLSKLRVLKIGTKRNIVEVIDTLMAYRGTEEILQKVVEVINTDTKLSILKYDLNKMYPGYFEVNRADQVLTDKRLYNNPENTDLGFSSRIVATNDENQKLLSFDTLDDYDTFVQDDKYWARQGIFRKRNNWFSRKQALEELRSSILSLPFHKIDTKYIGVLARVNFYERYTEMVYKMGLLMQYGTSEPGTGTLLNLDKTLGLDVPIRYEFDGVEWEPSQLFTLCVAIMSHIDIHNKTVRKNDPEYPFHYKDMSTATTIYPPGDENGMLESTLAKRSKDDPEYDVMLPKYFQFKRLAKLILMEEEAVAHDITDLDDGLRFKTGPYTWEAIKEFSLIKLTPEERSYEYGTSDDIDTKIDTIVREYNENLHELRVGDYIKAVHMKEMDAIYLVDKKEDLDQKYRLIRQNKGLSLEDLEDKPYDGVVMSSGREKEGPLRRVDIPIPTFNKGKAEAVEFSEMMDDWVFYRNKFIGKFGSVVDKAHTSMEMSIGRAWESVRDYFYTDISIEGDYTDYLNSKGYENENGEIVGKRNTFHHYFQDQSDPIMLRLYENKVLNAVLRHDEFVDEGHYLFEYWKAAQNAFINSIKDIIKVEEDFFDTDLAFREGAELSLLLDTMVSIYVEMRNVSVVYEMTADPEDCRVYMRHRLMVALEELKNRDGPVISGMDSDKVGIYVDDRYEENIELKEVVMIEELHTADIHTDQDGNRVPDDINRKISLAELNEAFLNIMTVKTSHIEAMKSRDGVEPITVRQDVVDDPISSELQYNVARLAGQSENISISDINETSTDE